MNFSVSSFIICSPYKPKNESQKNQIIKPESVQDVRVIIETAGHGHKAEYHREDDHEDAVYQNDLHLVELQLPRCDVLNLDFQQLWDNFKLG